MNWFHRTSLKYKLSFPIAFVAMLFIVLVSQIFSVYNQQRDANILLSEKVQPVLNDLDGAYRDMYQIMNAGMGIALTSADDTATIQRHTENYKDEASKVGDRISSVHQLIDVGFLPSQSRSKVDTLLNNYNQWQLHYKTMVDAPTQALEYYRNYGLKAEDEFEAIRSQLKAVQGEIEAKQLETLHNVHDHAKRTNQILIFGMIAIVLFSAAIIYTTHRFITRPITKLTDAMKQVASRGGDLSQRMQVNSSDEIGELAEAFNTFISKIHFTLEKVVATTHQVKNEATELTSFTRQLVGTSNAQQAQYQQLSEAANELTSMADSVSHHAADAEAATQEISQQSQQVDASLNNTKQSVLQLASDIDSSSQLVQTLETSVGEIDSILDVIQGIAEQTNLLALNAAIEAARAGEQGRGFAVVSDEVRSLATKTQSSTTEIQNMIEKLKKLANQTVQAMQANTLSGGDTVEHTENTHTSLEGMNQALETINEMNSHMATASAQQQHVSSELLSGIQKIVNDSEATLSSVQHARQACDSLANQSQALDELVSQFKV
ncbi:methyl-accepting chemotaxis protein [Thaumasiovibrio subtropicus]|uniref:methyl-accepting chemotaxis protein n=1 Tax=Thaumasiovibrio subtropicus TaxID=1891207 RepID=UPI000B35A4C5|nr:methyl-accepting chemotaxis protein [Thaumasiovibrio subtropicus]